MVIHADRDAFDARLLELARADGAGRRLSNRDIAKRLHVDESTVRRRLAKLQEQGGVPHPGGGSRATMPLDHEIPVTLEEPIEESAAPSIPRELVEKLVKLTKRGASLEELCDRMDLSPRRVRELVETAKSQGYTLDIHGPHVGHRPAEAKPLEACDVVIRAAGERRIFAQITDLHFGSDYHRNDFLHDFVDLAYARGVRTILVTGDILEGCYKHAQWQLSHHGYEAQAALCARTLPQKPGLTYHGITGNHDETFEDAGGMLLCRALVETFRAHGRDDLTMYGQRKGRLVLKSDPRERGLVVELWHPRGSAAYSWSYKPQKKIESYQPGGKPDVLFVGHYHQSGYFNMRGIHAFQGGTFQGGGGPFGNSLPGGPSIGGWIVEYAQTADGTVRRFAPEWIGYFEGETAREVAVGS